MSEDERHTGASTSPQKESMNVDTPTPEAEAGPSRIRRSSTTTNTDPISESGPVHSCQPPRPSSPSNTLPDESNGDASESSTDKKEEDPPRTTPYLDLATYPTQQLIRMLASLLQQIASANDQLRPETNDDQDEDGMGDENSTSSGSRSRADSRTSNSQPPASTTSTSNPPAGQAQSLVNPALNPAHPSPTTALFSEADAAIAPSTGLRPRDPTRRQSTSPTTGRAETLFTASKSSLNHRSSLLSFHARHIPSISIEAYLLRILKYCPTTNEVFLGLLVYFDRMSRLGTPGGLGGMTTSGKGFAIDSYNVHRLVIAGVTVASKFFSGSSPVLYSFVNTILTTRCVLHKLAIRKSRRATTPRTQSTRTPVPTPKRFQARDPIRRDAALRKPSARILGEQGGRRKEWCFG